MLTVNKTLQHIEAIEVIQDAKSQALLNCSDPLFAKDMKEALEVIKTCLSGFEAFEQMLRTQIAKEVLDKLDYIEDCKNVRQSVEHIILGEGTPNVSRCNECGKTSCESNPNYQGVNEWCTDCKEYDAEKHCCPRFNHVIKETLKEWKEQHKGE